MMMSGRRIRAGTATGKAVVCECPVSFLGGVDPRTGEVLEKECSSCGQSISRRIFCFPFGKGSTVGSYSLYQLKLNGKAPAGIVNSSAEPIVATGAIIAEVPMVDGIDVGLLRTGDAIHMDASRGTLEVKGVVEKHVVTCIVRNGDRILLLQRSEKVGSFQRRWAGVSGFVEEGETDEVAARREMQEEIGREKAVLVRHVETQRFRDGKVVWCVHPFLFNLKNRRISTDWEHSAAEWIRPCDVSRYETVPGLQKILTMLL